MCLCVPVRDILDEEPVIILCNCSWLPHLVVKMPSYYPGVAGREREREREKVKENNCHSRFIEILVLQCVTAVILTHSTYHFVSGLCSRSHIPFAVMAHSWTTQRLLKCAAGLPWQWLPYTLSLNFSERTRDIHHSFYFFLSKQFCVCLCRACGQVKLSSFPAILCFLSLCLAVFSFYLSEVPTLNSLSVFIDWTLHW